MDMKSLLEKMDQLSQVDEETKKKPDADGDGVPDWADKKPGKDDKEDKDEKEKVDEAISVQADGDEAMALLSLLKLAGQEPAEPPAPMAPQDGIEMSVEEEDPVYANTPDEMVADTSAAIPSGNDMHKKKDQFKHNYRGGDNPMAMREEVKKLEGKLAKMFESMTKE